MTLKKTEATVETCECTKITSQNSCVCYDRKMLIRDTFIVFLGLFYLFIYLNSCSIGVLENKKTKTGK